MFFSFFKTIIPKTTLTQNNLKYNFSPMLSPVLRWNHVMGFHLEG